MYSRKGISLHVTAIGRVEISFADVSSELVSNVPQGPIAGDNEGAIHTKFGSHCLTNTQFARCIPHKLRKMAGFVLVCLVKKVVAANFIIPATTLMDLNFNFECSIKRTKVFVVKTWLVKKLWMFFNCNTMASLTTMLSCCQATRQKPFWREANSFSISQSALIANGTLSKMFERISWTSERSLKSNLTALSD